MFEKILETVIMLCWWHWMDMPLTTPTSEMDQVGSTYADISRRGRKTIFSLWAKTNIMPPLINISHLNEGIYSEPNTNGGYWNCNEYVFR